MEYTKQNLRLYTPDVSAFEVDFWMLEQHKENVELAARNHASGEHDRRHQLSHLPSKVSVVDTVDIDLQNHTIVSHPETTRKKTRGREREWKKDFVSIVMAGACQHCKDIGLRALEHYSTASTQAT